MTITNPVDGHSYEAYQIFTGKLTYDDDKDPNDIKSYTLSNIQWGSGVSSTAQAALGNAAEYAENLTDAKGFADTLVGTSGYLGTAISLNSAGTEVDPGYYLIKDVTTNTVSDTAGGEQTAYVVQVVKPTAITLKVGTTESDKKVKDINDSTDTAKTDWQDSADYDLGDDVPFRLSATLPANVLSFKKYHMTFHDKQSAGLSLKTNSIKVYVGTTEVGSGYTKDGKIADDDTFSIHIPDVTALKDTSGSDIPVEGGTKIYVEYESTLTGSAVVFGNPGNPNTSYVTYSNNPNVEEDGENGRTPDDTVWVFTLKTTINKVDGEGKPLAGAEFELKKYDKATSSWTTINKISGTGDAKFEFDGLDDGVYSIEETKTPDGYNTLDPAKFYINVEVTHTDSDENAADTITAFTVTPYKTFTESTGALSDQLDTISFNCNKGSGSTQINAKNASGETIKQDITSGEANATITNNKGATLPSTGDSRTTMLYIVGVILLAGAGILLVTRRRMKAE